MKRVNGKYRPWLWIQRLASRYTKPIPFGLWLINGFFQRILDINGHMPCMVHFTSRVIGDIEMGKNVYISLALSGNCYIQALNGVIIGDNTIFAPGVKIISSNHDKNDLNKHIENQPVKIGKNCWLGANAIILPGVNLGDNVIVGAGSIVTKSFKSGSVIVGNPAQLISMSEKR